MKNFGNLSGRMPRMDTCNTCDLLTMQANSESRKKTSEIKTFCVFLYGIVKNSQIVKFGIILAFFNSVI